LNKFYLINWSNHIIYLIIYLILLNILFICFIYLLIYSRT